MDISSALSTSECLLFPFDLSVAPSFLAVITVGACGLNGCRSLREDGSAFRVSYLTPGLAEAKCFRSADPGVRPLSSVSECLLFLLDLVVVSSLGADESWVFPNLQWLPLAGGTSFEGSGFALEFR